MKRLRLVLIAPLLSAAVPTAAQNPLRDFLVTGDRAVGLLAPRPIAGPGAQKIAWSSDGRYVLTVCAGRQTDAEIPDEPLNVVSFRKLKGQEQTWLSLYDIQTSRSEILWSGSGKNWTLQSPKWLSGVDTAYVVANEQVRDTLTGTVTKSEKRVLEISADDHTAQDLLKVPYEKSEPFMEVYPSPKLPRAVVAVVDREANPGETDPLQLYLIGTGVDALPPFQPHLGLIDPEIDWSSDGSVPVAKRTIAPKSDGATFAPQFYALNFLHGNTSEVQGPDKNAALESPKLILSGGASGPLYLGLGDKASRVRLSGDADSGEIAPNGKAVAFVSQGVAMVRQILELPLRDYYAMREPEERGVCERRAKRCFLWLTHYATDHDDLFPGSSGVVKALQPYSDDPTDFKGFDYLFGGGPRSGIEKARDTELGSVRGLTGRAVIYADGTIIWQSDGLAD